MPVFQGADYFFSQGMNARDPIANEDQRLLCLFRTVEGRSVGESQGIECKLYGLFQMVEEFDLLGALLFRCT